MIGITCGSIPAKSLSHNGFWFVYFHITVFALKKSIWIQPNCDVDAKRNEMQWFKKQGFKSVRK